MSARSTHSREVLLKALLLAICEEWGADAIRHCLAGIEERSSGAEKTNAPRANVRQGKRRKPSAVDLAGRLEVPEARKAILMSLAQLFDGKSFLPTASDVRYFLELRGQHPGVVRQRLDSFRKVLDVLEGIPDRELEGLVNSSIHSGPTQLGPLSDAIRSVSASRSQSTQTKSGALSGSHKPSDPVSISRASIDEAPE